MAERRRGDFEPVRVPTPPPPPPQPPRTDLADRIAEMGVIRPGDTLVVRLDHPVSMKDIDEYRAQFATAAPGVNVMFVCAEQALIVQRGEPNV